MSQLSLDLEITMTPAQAAQRCSDDWGRPQNWRGDFLVECAFQDALCAAVDAGLVEVRFLQRIRHHPSGEVRVLVEGVDPFPPVKLEHPPRATGWYGFCGWAEWRRAPLAGARAA